MNYDGQCAFIPSNITLYSFVYAKLVEPTVIKSFMKICIMIITMFKLWLS